MKYWPAVVPRSTSASTANSGGSVTFDLPATSLMAERKHADQPAARSCSGLVPSPFRKLDVEPAVGRARRAALAAARGVGLGGVKDFFDWRDGHGGGGLLSQL